MFRIKEPSPMVSSSRRTLASKENTAAEGRLNTEGTAFSENTMKRKMLNRNKTSVGSISNNL